MERTVYEPSKECRDCKHHGEVPSRLAGKMQVVCAIEPPQLFANVMVDGNEVAWHHVTLYPTPQCACSKWEPELH